MSTKHFKYLGLTKYPPYKYLPSEISRRSKILEDREKEAKSDETVEGIVLKRWSEEEDSRILIKDKANVPSY